MRKAQDARRESGRCAFFTCRDLSLIHISSVPDFIMGAIMQYFFGVKWGLLPIAQYKGLSYTILPLSLIHI